MSIEYFSNNKLNLVICLLEQCFVLILLYTLQQIDIKLINYMACRLLKKHQACICIKCRVRQFLMFAVAESRLKTYKE